MLILPLDEARPGMRLAAPVLNPESPDKVLLKSGYELETSVVVRLRDLGIEAVFVEYPALEDLDKHLAAFLSPARQEIYKHVKKALVATQNATRPVVPYKDYYSSTRDLITTLLNQGQHPIYLDQMNRMGSDAVGHATAVAHLSLVMGMKLEMYLVDQRWRLPANRAKDVVNLGVAGMLHDLGKMQLPEALRKYSAVHTPEDHKEQHDWENHSRLGYEIVHDGIEPSAASAVLHHHQHFDGSGFPIPVQTDGSKVPLEGQRIHVFSRIVMLADLYDRLSTLPDGRRRSNLEILHLIRSKYAGWCDPTILKTLQQVAPPFPPGTRLSLSDGSMAVVTSVDPENLYRPTVRKLMEDRWTVGEEYIDLRQPDSPTIVSIGNTQVASYLPHAHAMLAAT